MSTSDAEHPAHAPYGVVDQAVNRATRSCPAG
jgi:hypothetical protein